VDPDFVDHLNLADLILSLCDGTVNQNTVFEIDIKHFSKLQLGLQERTFNVLAANFVKLQDFLFYRDNEFIRLQFAGELTAGKLAQLQFYFKNVLIELFGASALENHPLNQHSDSNNPTDRNGFKRFHAPLGNKFPILSKYPIETPIYKILLKSQLPARARQLFMSTLPTIGSLLSLTHDQLLNYKNVGETTALNIIQALEIAEQSTVPIIPDEELPSRDRDHQLISLNKDDLINMNLYRKLFPDKFKFINGITIADNAHPNIKTVLIDSVNSLFNNQTMEPSQAVNLDVLIDTLIATLSDDRASSIIQQRALSVLPKTLEEMGHELGITRERVRQIELKSHSSLLLITQEREFQVFSYLIYEISENFPKCFTTDDLLAFLGSVNSIEFHSPDLMICWTKLLLKKTHKLTNKTYVPFDHKPNPANSNQVDSFVFNKNHFLKREDIHSTLKCEGWSKSLIDEYTSSLVPIQDEYYFSKRIKSEGFVEAILHLENKPLEYSEIIRRTLNRWSPNGLRERIKSDPRFIKLPNNKIALKSWGDTEYGPLKTALDKYLASQPDQKCNYLELINHFTSLGYKKSTIQYYLTAPKYEDIGSEISYRHDLATYSVPQKWKSAKDFYPIGLGKFSYRILVKSDVIKGIGPKIPGSVFTFLGGKVDQTTEFFNDLDDISVRISWPKQMNEPSLSTLREICAVNNAKVNDYLLLFFDTYSTQFHSKLIKHLKPTSEWSLAEKLEYWTGIAMKCNDTDRLDYLCELFSVHNPDALKLLLANRNDQILLNLIDNDSILGNDDLNSLLR
jgi:hypothetical protein